MKLMFFATEINLILWLYVFGQIWFKNAIIGSIKIESAIGLLVASLIQHWAYYNLYKKNKAKKI